MFYNILGVANLCLGGYMVALLKKQSDLDKQLRKDKLDGFKKFYQMMIEAQTEVALSERDNDSFARA